MSYKADQARLLYLVEETNPYVSEYDDSDETDNVEVLDINTDSEQEVSDYEKYSIVPSDFSIREPYFLSKDGSIKWKKHFPLKNVRTRSENIITHLPGVKGDTKKLKSPIDLWKCFIYDDILDVIVEYTNKIISTAKYPVSSRAARLTNKTELKALLGLLYLSGVRKTNHLNASDLWKKMERHSNYFVLQCHLTDLDFW
ncbi:hypothetical protein NQ314_012143 [Rhamnusium bicolor]|uniref:PiggyBac transposable element-derived protein domain-containing protein n=1 Tax=Rhamnusium bicolor TaxID=1586634 RepID=A0AAV8XEC8_9CUCU|nr:hypothetical protein NQ314_012143 [Rhamnusium bicolor]